jgi:hypothetical protein
MAHTGFAADAAIAAGAAAHLRNKKASLSGGSRHNSRLRDQI